MNLTSINKSEIRYAINNSEKKSNKNKSEVQDSNWKE
jgi:hypothetical protein